MPSDVKPVDWMLIVASVLNCFLSIAAFAFGFLLALEGDPIDWVLLAGWWFVGAALCLLLPSLAWFVANQRIARLIALAPVGYVFVLTFAFVLGAFEWLDHLIHSNFQR